MPREWQGSPLLEAHSPVFLDHLAEQSHCGYDSRPACGSRLRDTADHILSPEHVGTLRPTLAPQGRGRIRVIMETHGHWEGLRSILAQVQAEEAKPTTPGHDETPRSQKLCRPIPGSSRTAHVLYAEHKRSVLIVLQGSMRPAKTDHQARHVGSQSAGMRGHLVQAALASTSQS